MSWQVGVLDFGDSIYSCRIFEPGISAGYFCLGQVRSLRAPRCAEADPISVLEEVLRGFEGRV